MCSFLKDIWVPKLIAWELWNPVTCQRQGWCSIMSPGPASSEGDHVFPIGTHTNKCIQHICMCIYIYIHTAGCMGHCKQKTQHLQKHHKQHHWSHLAPSFVNWGGSLLVQYIYTNTYVQIAEYMCIFIYIVSRICTCNVNSSSSWFRYSACPAVCLRIPFTLVAGTWAYGPCNPSPASGTWTYTDMHGNSFSSSALRPTVPPIASGPSSIWPLFSLIFSPWTS